MADVEFGCAFLDDVLADTCDNMSESFCSLAEVLLLLPWKVFAQKNLLSTSSSLAAATCLVLVAREKCLFGGCNRAILLAHRRQIDPVSSEDRHAVSEVRMSIALGRGLHRVLHNYMMHWML